MDCHHRTIQPRERLSRSRVESPEPKVEVLVLRRRNPNGEQAAHLQGLPKDQCGQDVRPGDDPAHSRELSLHELEEKFYKLVGLIRDHQDLIRTKHAWKLKSTGTLTIKRIFVCERCGTQVECRSSQIPDSVTRNLGIPDDCDLAIAHHIHEA